MKQQLLLSVLFSTLLLLSGCGGSSDNPFGGGVAFVDISADPNSIDIGDRTLVLVRIDDLDDPSVFLKVRYSRGLNFVPQSSFIEVDGEDVPRAPDRIFSDDRFDYLIYFISREEIDNEDDTRLTFQLSGETRVSAGEIAVDPDLDDPTIDNNVEFDINNPEFSAEDSTSIVVR